MDVICMHVATSLLMSYPNACYVASSLLMSYPNACICSLFIADELPQCMHVASSLLISYPNVSLMIVWILLRNLITFRSDTPACYV